MGKAYLDDLVVVVALGLSSGGLRGQKIGQGTQGFFVEQLGLVEDIVSQCQVFLEGLQRTQGIVIAFEGILVLELGGICRLGLIELQLLGIDF